MSRRFLALLLLMATPFVYAPFAHAQAREEARALIATQVLEELRGQRDQYIPDLLLERAYGIAVIPEVKKVAFGVGGRFGRGVLVVRDKQGRWANPVFVALTGGSFGWQVGAQETDIVLVFTTRRGIEGISGGKLTLGADASVAAGPVGRAASASTDTNFSAEIYSYSRNRGLFAGVALDGTAITIEDRANRAFYGNKNVLPSDILSGSVTKNSETVRRLLAAVTSTRAGGTATPPATAPTATGSPAPAAAATTGAAPAAGTATGTEARSYPMEDAKPGQEPPK
jgi:lipid-binding SYLF domain-containing protein